ncbi:hypothetical protein GGR52DRAFT_576912 [Hypoxylon sp. FL1284]|nr:hypothetical protein GGR52DRAFT_576912 [Hypoxylon sp. FL1284]
MASAPGLTIPPDESRGPTLSIVIWTSTAIATAFVALRIYTRFYITKSQGWDDAVIVLSAILNLIGASLCSASIAHGVGRHIYYISDEDMTKALYYDAIERAPGILAYNVPKLSVVILLVRLMGNARRHAWVLYSVITVLFITSILAISLYLGRCRPIEHLWNPSSSAECLPDRVFDTVSYFCGAWSAFTDVVLAVFPITLFWNLQMKKSRKISLMILMALGSIASVAAILKTTQISTNHAVDEPWDAFWLTILTYVEVDLVIIAACAPTLPKLVGKAFVRKEEVSENSRYRNFTPIFRGYRAFDSQSESTINMHRIEHV